jgi:hypothetical protein
MKNLFAAAAVSIVAIVTMPTFAADVAKKDELTMDQRAEMRARADQMKTQRNSAPTADTTKDKVQQKAHKPKQSS